MSKLKTTEQFIAEAVSVHGRSYDYSNVEYKGASSKIKIICPTHGTFEQRPAEHTSSKKGCYQCGRISSGQKRKYNTETIVKMFQSVHGQTYDYSNVKYTKSSNKVIIGCPLHGDWEQTPNNHLNGYGCPGCVGRVSKAETEWLDSLGVPNTPLHRQVSLPISGGRVTADGFDPNTNTVYEYYGSYWHGDPSKYPSDEVNVVAKKTYGELHQLTLIREARLRNAGYNVCVKWA